MTHLTPDQIAHLKSEHAKGTPYSQIGADLGVSKNAISGQVHRMGLSAPLAKRPAKPKAPRLRVRQQPICGRAVETVDFVEMPPVSIEDAARDRASLKTLVELEAGACKWPIGDCAPFLFCGDPVRDDNCPYCIGHAKRAFNSGAYRSALRPYQPQRVTK